MNCSTVKISHSDSYTFEVSSPGLGRPLKKEKDYVRNMGKEIEIRIYRAIDRCKEFTGILKAYDDTSVTIADEKRQRDHLFKDRYCTDPTGN